MTRLSHNPAVLRQTCRRLYSSSRTIRENDVLFLRQRGEKSAKWHLTSPLRPESEVKLSYGATFKGSELIGKNVLDVVHDGKGRDVVLHVPSMASYIINKARFATPIYPQDATTIVSLLDLDLPRPGEEEEASPPFEIFEAGTGMGSLTLHLSRAIQAANPAVPPSLRKAFLEATFSTEASGPDLSPEDQVAYDNYRQSRRAILHTLDQRLKHTKEAYKMIRNYRRSLYSFNIDFHVGSINEYISGRLEQNDQLPFLSHAILDLPSAEEHAELVIKAMHRNAQLILFNPSISQIADFQAWAVATKQPLRLERVLELPTSTVADGVGETGGGKEWDIKTAVPKSDEGQGKIVQVMRPKVGDRVAGGGFVAAFRRFPEQPPKNQ